MTDREFLINNLINAVNNRLIVSGDFSKTKAVKMEKTKSTKTNKIGSSMYKDQKTLLEEVKARVLKCQACRLHETKKKYVFGDGNPDARLMFIGEAPGYNEDVQGIPFVGRAGKLLDKMLKAMELERKDIFIANILKCRPPNNRNPLPEEVEACTGYLEEQIEIISPEVICSLGLFAGQFLVKNYSVKMGDIRGKQFEYDGIKVIPTYHPAYLLRNPSAKKKVWDDMILVMKLLGMKNKWTEKE